MADDDEQPTEHIETPEPTTTEPRFHRRTAVWTIVGVSALLITFFSGYAVGEHDDDGERRDRGERGGMRWPGGAPAGRGGDFRGERGTARPGARDAGFHRPGRGGGAVGAVTKVDGDTITVKPAHGGDEVTADVDEVRVLGRGAPGTVEPGDLEVGDIVVVPAADDTDAASGD
ncbi:MAG: hypothetical protein JWO69_472 [Thermoleophilia bacterium]|jgi:hypothetical protein|nr:hypothetical protein [Thermoleophilia bacterium]